MQNIQPQTASSVYDVVYALPSRYFCYRLVVRLIVLAHRYDVTNQSGTWAGLVSIALSERSGWMTFEHRRSGRIRSGHHCFPRITLNEFAING